MSSFDKRVGAHITNKLSVELKGCYVFTIAIVATLILLLCIYLLIFLLIGTLL